MNRPDSADVIVVGAGMTGLSAAVRLQSAGAEVIVVDKARGVGGRIASRRIGEASFDHGAQFITAGAPEFAAALASWQEAGVVRPCFGSGAQLPSGSARWCGTPAMTAIAKHLAAGITVRLEQRVCKLQRMRKLWKAVTENGESMTAKGVLLTPPVPQSLALLEASNIRLADALRSELEAVDYQRCIAVMAVLEAPSSIPPPGFVMPQDGPVAWIADNQRKEISALPAVTIQASDEFSREHWNDDREATGESLIELSSAFLGSPVRAFDVHGWLYSMPVASGETGFKTLEKTPPLMLAGDAFVRPRVEGAWCSGQAAADALLGLIQPQ